MIKLTEPINEKSTRCFYIVLRDQMTGNAVTPTALLWTLVDTDEAVINLREQVVVDPGDLGASTDSYGNIATVITVSGDDLGIKATETDALITRHLVLEGTYDGACANDLPITDYVEFQIENIPYIKLV